MIAIGNASVMSAESSSESPRIVPKNLHSYILICIHLLFPFLVVRFPLAYLMNIAIRYTNHI